MYGSFVFDGKASQSFGLLMAGFNSKGLRDASAGCQTAFEKESNYDGSKWYSINNKYSEPLEFAMELIKTPCPNQTMYFTRDEARAVLSWLCSPQDYKPLRIDSEFYYGMNFKAKFINPKYKLVGERICGFEIAVVLEQPFALSDDILFRKTFSGSGEMVLYNHSDEFEKSLYPQQVTVTALSAGTITIRNEKEKPQTATEFTSCISGEAITMNCEERRITSTNASSPILRRFNKNWIRLSHGKNTFAITGNCSIEFKYNEIRRVGVW